jgi:hypothetical protein
MFDHRTQALIKPVELYLARNIKCQMALRKRSTINLQVLAYDTCLQSVLKPCIHTMISHV